MSQIKKKKDCRLCGSKKIRNIFNLCNSPLANNLSININTSLKTKKYPLNLMICKNCKHVQLGHVVNEKKLYKNYFYMTGISKQFRDHFKNYADSTLKLFNANSNLKILEIGSNDCTLLDNFKKKRFTTVGIEPATNLWRLTKNRHKIINGFYDKKTNIKLLKKYKSFDIILANNVFAHIDNIKQIFLLLKKLMHDKSIIIFEVSYLLDVIKKKLFDTIYHEHLDYHSIEPLVSFFKKIDLKIIDLKKISTHGGSIRVYIAKNSTVRLAKTKKIYTFIKNEKKNGVNKESTIVKMFNKLEVEKFKLENFFQKIKGNVVYGYGAPAKAVTLINYFNLNEENINLIIDDSKLKQNKYIPGSKIIITNSRILYSKPPKYIIILAWNIYKDILAKLKNFKNIGYIVIPLPKFRLIKL